MLRPGAGRTNLYSCACPLWTENFAPFPCVPRSTPNREIGLPGGHPLHSLQSYSSPLVAERICCR